MPDETEALFNAARAALDMYAHPSHQKKKRKKGGGDYLLEYQHTPQYHSIA